MSSIFEPSTFAATTMDSQSGESELGSYGFLGRYRLDRMIGHGAMGAVFEAYDDTLGRTIAIKTLYTQPAVDDETVVNGFDTATVDAAILQEARTAATLNHPHIVTVFDAGRAHSSMLKRDLPYVAMELLHGDDLRQRMAQLPALSQREAVSLIGKVALALDHAHKGGVLHRDIKPANIFITKKNGPKILDFGLARFTARAAQARNTSSSDVIAGSPQYMSPEMVRSIDNVHQVVDARSDVFSLGVILYELLCGKKPFTAATLEQLQEQILHAQPQLPYEANPAVPRDLSVIMMNALAKKPEDRYRSAGQLARELRRWGSGAGEHDPEATLARSSPSVPRATSPAPLIDSDDLPTQPPPLDAEPVLLAPEPSRQRKVPLVAVGVAALVAVGAALWFMLRPSAPPAVPPSLASAEPAITTAPQATLSPGESIVEPSKPAATPAKDPATSNTPPAAPASPVTAAPVATTAPVAAPAASEQVPTPSAASNAPSPANTTAQATEAAAAPTTGRVRVNVLPWGAIEVNGKKMGVSPPLTMLTLEPGEHTVVVRNSDFAARSFRIKVEAGKTERVSHKFE